MESRRPSRRVPSQERSRSLVKAVREAGVLILAEEGLDAVDELRAVDLDHASVLLSQGVPALLRGVLDKRPDLLEDDSFRESIVDLVCVWLFGERAEGADPEAGDS
jgi:hypothetical protein